jgi:protein SCO1/2/putative membrane protein
MNVSRSYRRGILVVAYTVMASAILSPWAAHDSLSSPRAAQELGELGENLRAFQLVERSGRTVTDADLADRVWIGAFIFTRCPLSCPRITGVMKSLQGRLESSQVLLVSLSVDPEHDTPQVLDEYARRYGAAPDRWWFLTGPRASIYDLIQDKFKLSVTVNPAADPDGRGEAISHSDRLALVDRGRVVGLFDSNDPAALDDLVLQAKRRAMPAWVRNLPTVNASLNGLCAILLVTGWTLIRRRDPASEWAAKQDERPIRASESLLTSPPVRGHIVFMVLAVLTSAVFLGCYLTYHSYAGSVRFQGHGPIRLFYFTVLISHTLLATFGVVPLVILTLVRALRRDFSRHMSIAALTIPIWLYVSLTGVVVYLLLYHLPVSPGTVSPQT